MNINSTARFKFPKRSSLILAAGFALATLSTGHAQTLVLSLQSKNYNPTTGVWTDSSGNGNNATNATAGVANASAPTLTTGVTPNGSSAVTFTTGSFLNLTTGITAGNTAGYTAFAFLRPTTTQPNGFTNGSGGTIFGGPTGGTFQYRLSNGFQDILRSQQADLTHGSTALSITTFSSINVTTSSTGGAYRLNGATDGANTGSTYSQAISLIGTNNPSGGNEFFNGSIADIELYSGVLTTAQIQTVEANFAAQYVNVPEPSTWALALVGVGMLFGVQRFRARKA